MAVNEVSVPATSVDLERVSIITSTPSNAATDEAGRGSIYTSATHAAGRLFHVHRAEDAFLCSYATQWTAATPAANAPGQWSAKTVRARPTFWWANPAAAGSVVGALSRAAAARGDIYPQGAVDLRINSAGSQRDMLVYLGWHKSGAFLAQYHVAKGYTQFLGTNWCAPILNAAEARVEWDRGVYVLDGHAFVVGATSGGQLYLMKRRVGRQVSVAVAHGWGQLYLGERGWMIEPEDATPMTDDWGTPILSSGAVSLAHYRDVWLMSTVVQSGGNWIANFYRSSHPLRGWTKLTPITPVVFGPNTLNPLLLGAHFQTALTANPAYIAASPRAEDRGGVPYTYTTETSVELRTQWGVLTVPSDRL